MSYEVVPAASFKRCLKRLKKRFPNVNQDVIDIVRDLVDTPTLGVVIPGGGGTRKVRVRNRNAGKGKQGGYRLIYYVADQPVPRLYLLLLYAKADQVDVTQQELKQLLDELSEGLEE